MNIIERIKKMSKKKQIGIATLMAIVFVAVSIVLYNYTFKIVGMILAEKTGFILFNAELTGLLFGAGLLLICCGILKFILSKNKKESIKEIANGTYEMLESFGMIVGGMIADFLLILFASMNFNKIVTMSVQVVGADTGIATTGLTIGILALSVRGIFRALSIGNLNFYIKKFLNTNKEVEYEQRL